jgi:hypothetical protein
MYYASAYAYLFRRHVHWRCLELSTAFAGVCCVTEQ